MSQLSRASGELRVEGLGFGEGVAHPSLLNRTFGLPLWNFRVPTFDATPYTLQARRGTAPSAFSNNTFLTLRLGLRVVHNGGPLVTPLVAGGISH